MAKLIVQPGTAAQADIPLRADQPLSIGRAGTNDIVVDRRMASRTHASIEAKDGSFFVVDRSSYNGTFVNESPVTRAKLSHGDRIRIASWFLRFSETDDGDSEDTLQNVAAVDPDPSRTGTAPGTRLELDEPGLDPDDVRLLADTTDPFSPVPAQALSGIAAPAAAVVPPTAKATTAKATTPKATGTTTTGTTTTSPTTATSPLATTTEPLVSARPANQPAPARAASQPLADSPPASAGPTSAADGKPTAVAERQRGESGARSQPPRARLRVWPGLAALAVVATIVLLWRQGNPEPPTIAQPAATPSPADPDLAQLEAALSADFEVRTDRLWDFIIGHPHSPLRERAYIALIDAGGSLNLICENAWRSAPELLTPGSPLELRCPR